MNILLFVTSLIMLLTAMTYARLANFFESHTQAVEWQAQMEETERSVYNHEMLRQLAAPPKKTTPPATTTPPPAQKTPDDKQPDPDPKPAAPKSSPKDAKIHFRWFTDKAMREGHEQEFAKYYDLTKTLIRILYSQQPFFKIMEKSRPDFLDDLLQEIMRTSDGYLQLDQKNKIASLSDLMYLKWSDLELKRLFSRLMSQTPIYKRVPEPDELPPTDAEEEFDKGEFDQTIPYSKEGYQSLNDYFTIRKADKIHVYLASKPLLLALFRDPQIVARIIEMRNHLYLQVRKKNPSISKEDATKEFESNFKSLSLYEAILDFTVTTTDPRKR